MTPYKFPLFRVSEGALKETVLCGTLQLFVFIAVWLRLWSRRLNQRRLEFNDYAILVALFFCVGLLAIAITCKKIWNLCECRKSNVIRSNVMVW